MSEIEQLKNQVTGLMQRVVTLESTLRNKPHGPGWADHLALLELLKKHGICEADFFQRRGPKAFTEARYAVIRELRAMGWQIPRIARAVGMSEAAIRANVLYSAQ
jgi:hypothetical protein